MRTSTITLILFLAASLPGLRMYGQDSAVLSSSQRISTQYIDKVSSKAASLEQKLDKKSERALRQFQKQEDRLRKKLSRIDSSAAVNIFSSAENKYKDFETKLQNATTPKNFIPSLDTVSTSLSFLQANPQFLSQAKEVKEKLKDAAGKISELKAQFQKAEDIKQFIKERKDFLKRELSKFGFAKELKKISKQAYYFQQQCEEYKAMLKDQKRAERKAIELLSKTKPFKEFFRKNSQLASLFRLPGSDPNDPSAQASLAGLQTRATVNNLIQQQIASAGPGGQAQFSANLQAAQTQLNELKNKISTLGGSSSDAELPEGFSKNDQRTKRFWKKWEAGINVQSNRSNGIMPVSSLVGLSAGFKPNNWFTGGFGVAGRIGWGKDIRHIAITYSGVSARSFAEVKLKKKGSFHAVAAFEMNYRPEIRSVEELKNYSAWQKSGLVGISKVVSVKSKFFKKTKLQLMWDYLAAKQVPRSQQPIIFRIGYNF